MKRDDQITRNFALSEFASGDGARMPDVVEMRIRTLLAPALQVIRDELQGPLRITSGWRSFQHNKAVGGARNSQHLHGFAADLQPPSGVPVEDLHTLILELIHKGKIPEGGVGLYPSWVHYDVRGTAARWSQR